MNNLWEKIITYSEKQDINYDSCCRKVTVCNDCHCMASGIFTECLECESKNVKIVNFV